MLMRNSTHKIILCVRLILLPQCSACIIQLSTTNTVWPAPRLCLSSRFRRACDSTRARGIVCVLPHRRVLDKEKITARVRKVTDRSDP
ncbi:hypothetical protein B0J11DRAFT_289125 [Dendryphion nanum]|uniref:Secreted protein n=1 Tax=Dendryphion nanum TaxID=256645 RepID=A0A9P9DYP4_9PLEO|nr:hypothetical protein B0J11DRAFT_289125 [Dendryphion nanum]